MTRAQLAEKILSQVIRGEAMHADYAQKRAIQSRESRTEEARAKFDEEWPYKVAADFQLPLVVKLLDSLDIEVR